MNEREETNKKLVEEYPYLLPRNVWTGEVVDGYDYSWTELDNVPMGWVELFLHMCEEIREPLIQANYIDEFRFLQIKEKYGSLRAYTTGAPEEVHNIINKYEALSQRTCVECGKPATKISQGWICPYCDECAEKLSQRRKFMDIEEWFGEEDE